MARRTLLAFTVLLIPGPLVGQESSVAKSSAPFHTLDPQTSHGLQQLFHYDGQTLLLVSAHRGGAVQDFPQNCLATFENTLRQTFAILEIDPRYAKDGEIVVHHDPTLDRTTTGMGRVADHTVRELKELRLKDLSGVATEYQIPTLDEVLEWARGKTILVLDQKDVPVAARVKKIEEHRAESYAMLIVYSFDGARECYALNKSIMMEVMIPDREQLQKFERNGVPWSNIVAFVGHNPPKDPELLRMLHDKGVSCIAGTSRNLDRTLAAQRGNRAAKLRDEYRSLLSMGVDLLETDLPSDVARLLFAKMPIPDSKARFFQRPKQ